MEAKLVPAPFFAILVYGESERHKAQVNKGTEAAWLLQDPVTVIHLSGAA